MADDPHRGLMVDALGIAEVELEEAEEAVQSSPEDAAAKRTHAEKIVWAGRRLGYLWRMREAVDVYSKGLAFYPDDPALLRHRGHRHLSIRDFPAALADFQHARDSIGDRSNEVEIDGMPSMSGINLTTLGFNIQYHFALSHYLMGEFEQAAREFRATLHHCHRHDDNLVAVADWLFMSLRRCGKDEEAGHVLEWIRPRMTILENQAYHRRLMMYKGLLAPDELCDPERATELHLATLGYGLGVWRFLNGAKPGARDVWHRVVSGPYWPAFGFVASEVELAREPD